MFSCISVNYFEKFDSIQYFKSRSETHTTSSHTEMKCVLFLLILMITTKEYLRFSFYFLKLEYKTIKNNTEML